MKMLLIMLSGFFMGSSFNYLIIFVMLFFFLLLGLDNFNNFDFKVFMMVLMVVCKFMVSLVMVDLFMANLILLLMVLTYSIFNCLNLVYYYFYFEVFLILILVMINFDSSSYSRLVASFYLFFYMMVLSYLTLVLIFSNLLSCDFYFLGMLNVDWLNLMGLLSIFLVKMSYFGFHYWLIKVHAEVSLNMSIILSSIVLKVGSFGLLRLLNSFIFNLNSFFYVYSFLMMVILLGFMGFIMDFKVIIALSSVFYMNFTLYMLLMVDEVGVYIFKLLNLYHSLSSMIMFLFTGKFYSFNHSRSLSISGGVGYMLGFMFMGFLFFIIGFNVPLVFGFMGEVLIMMKIFNMFGVELMVFLSLLILTFIYNLFIYVLLCWGGGVNQNISFSCWCVNYLYMYMYMLLYLLLSFMVIEGFS